MSLILDALNRSDQERNECNQVPGIQSVHRPRQAASRPSRWRRLHPERWLLLAIAVYLLVDLITGRRVSQPAPPPQAQIAAAARLQPTPASAQPRPAAGSEHLGEIAALYRGEPVVVPAVPPAPPRRRPPAVNDALSTEKLSTLISEAREAAPGSTGFLAAPYITQLAPALRRQIPTLNYSEHRFARSGGAHRVRLNGQLLAEGQAVAPDLTLVAIYAEGIVLDFQGVRFRLKALNRWVNF